MQPRLLFFSKQYHQKQHHTCHDQRGQENIGTGHKGFCTVTVDDALGIGKHQLTDPRTNDTREQHLRENAHALESACLACRGQVTNFRTEHRRSAQITTHHEQRADKHKQFIRAQIQHHKAHA